MHPRIAASVRVAPVRMESLPRPSGVRVPAEADEMMEYDDPRKGIGIYQRFLIATGEAAQQGAQLELNLRLLRQRLTSDGHTGAVTAALESGEFVAPAVKGEKVVPPASTLIDDCLQMIPKELTVEPNAPPPKVRSRLPDAPCWQGIESSTTCGLAATAALPRCSERHPARIEGRFS